MAPNFATAPRRRACSWLGILTLDRYGGLLSLFRYLVQQRPAVSWHCRDLQIGGLILRRRPITNVKRPEDMADDVDDSNETNGLTTSNLLSFC
jgi:hypothetical protein